MKESNHNDIKFEEFSSQIYPCPCNKKTKSTPPLGNSRLYTKTGQWTDQQKRTYLDFLKNNQRIFLKNQAEDLKRAFREMSRCVKTRKPNQCKLYHQKMENYYQSVPNVIYFLSQYVEVSQKKEECSSQLTPHQLYRYQDRPSMIKKQKESPNNSQQSYQQIQVPYKKAKRRRLSLNIPIEEQPDYNKDEDLPRTDHSIGFVGSQAALQMDHNALRYSVPVDFAEYQPLRVQNESLLVQNAFYPQVLQYSHPLSFVSNLRQFYCGVYSEEMRRNSSPSNQDLWECHSIFLAWQERLSNLMGRAKPDK